MPRYAALLRGITPSGPNMTNDVLRAAFEGLGLTHVASVLASGNLLFDSPETDARALERRIEDALHAGLGLASRTLLRTREELLALLGSDPFPGLTHGRGTYLTATFLAEADAHPDRLAAQPDPLTTVVRYDEAARAVLAVTDASTPGRTPTFLAWLDRAYGKGLTTRSWLTVQRIGRRLGG